MHTFQRCIVQHPYITTPVPRLGSPPPPHPPILSHGSIYFLITQNGAENYKNLETSTIQEEN